MNGIWLSNEFLTFVQIILCFGLVSVAYRIFGKVGMYAAAAVMTVFANLEVSTCTNFAGMVVSLGNVAFVGNALIQDTLNECEGGEKVAKHTVWIGFAGCLLVLLVSRISILFTPTVDSVSIHNAFCEVMGPFSIVTLISLGTYLISNRLNVRLYAIFSKHTKKAWLRSQGSSWISQLVDSVIFTVVCACFGIFNWTDVLVLIVTTYIIKIFCVIGEVPFLYLNKKLKASGKVRDILSVS